MNADDLPVKDHLAKDILDVCAYCGTPFQKDEVVIERMIHGRKWRFCSETCLRDFEDAVQFQDEDKDGYEPGVYPGEKDD